ncbi:MAG: archease [Minisyncoccia bacterium]
MGYQYEIKEHPADVKLKVKAASLKELFEGALKGMAEILVSKKDLTEKRVQKSIKVESVDVSALIVDFLSEVLALTDINDSVFNDLEVIFLSEKKIEAKVKGFKVKSFKEEIKAVTYHKAEVKQNKSGEYEAEILFDI